MMWRDRRRASRRRYMAVSLRISLTTALVAGALGLMTGVLISGNGYCASIDEMTVCVPITSAGKPIKVWEDGSAGYSDGTVYDPETATLVKP